MVGTSPGCGHDFVDKNECMYKSLQLVFACVCMHVCLDMPVRERQKIELTA